LFVLNAYVANNQTQINKFKDSAKNLFRKKIVEFLAEKYIFYEVKPETNLETFVEQNFKLLAGKMYRPSGWDDRLLLAFEKEKITKKIEIAGVEIAEYKLKE
jgi:predicted secreted acid phosphatase